ncbi:MAG TPA: serine hydrolase [Vicinamibacterales bacterium]|nr:serine hydrolase [Vicinamibacterales bacterium]
MAVVTAVCALVGGGIGASAQSTSTKKPASTAGAPTPAPKASTTTTRSSLAKARAAAAERARRVAAARARERARVEQEAMTPKYRRDLLGNQIPEVRAAAAIVFDPQTNAVLWEQNAHDQRSIASLTKLMTAVTFVADEPDLEQVVAVTATDMRAASVTHLKAGDRLSYRDLLHLTLIASDNAAARVLARTSEGGTAAFVGRMNEMAVNLGMANTSYADPSGLDARNVSSAYDISHVITYAGADPVLGPIMRTQEYEVRTKTRTIPIHSTNRLLGTGMDVVGGKTGFISKAGYCLATLLRIPQGPQVAVVVLGASNSTTRFWEARHLFNWVVGRWAGISGGEQPSGPALEIQ